MSVLAYSLVHNQVVEINDLHSNVDGVSIYRGVLEDENGQHSLLFRVHELEFFHVNVKD